MILFPKNEWIHNDYQFSGQAIKSWHFEFYYSNHRGCSFVTGGFRLGMKHVQKSTLLRHPLQTEWIEIIYVIKGQLFVDVASLLSLQRAILDNSASQSESAVVAKFS